MFHVLTKAILSDLLTHWVPLGDVGRLDSALCGRVEREQFLTLLEADSFGKRTTVGKYSCKASFMTWVVKRNINLQLCELLVDGVLIGNWELQKSVLPLIGPNLKKVAVSKACVCTSELADKFILELSLHCTGLLECEFTTFSDAPMTALLARNPHMKSVKLNSTVQNQVSEMLHAIATLCSQIEYIAISCSVSTRSFNRFLESAPVTLTTLRLPSSIFTLTELRSLLRQCRDLVELRIGDYSPDYMPADLAHFVHPHLRLFRASSFYHPTYFSGLSKLMPNLTTIIILRPVGSPQTEGAAYDTAESVISLLTAFRYLRQLVVGDAGGDLEYTLYKLQSMPVPAVVAHSISNASYSVATRNTHAAAKLTLPTLPAAGSLLEELFSSHVMEVINSIALPALRSVGSGQLPEASLPAAVKKVTVIDWRGLCADEMIVHLRGLEEIDLQIGHGISDTGILHLTQQNPHLRVLRITQKTCGEGTMTAVGLWSVLQHCPLLHTVEYSVERTDVPCRKPKQTDYVLQQMCLKAFPNIKHLEYGVY